MTDPASPVTLTHFEVNEKKYKFDSTKVADAPKIAADFIQVSLSGDFAVISLGLREDAMGLTESDLIVPQATVYVSPALVENLAELFAKVAESRKPVPVGESVGQ